MHQRNGGGRWLLRSVVRQRRVHVAGKYLARQPGRARRWLSDGSEQIYVAVRVQLYRGRSECRARRRASQLDDKGRCAGIVLVPGQEPAVGGLSALRTQQQQRRERRARNV